MRSALDIWRGPWVSNRDWNQMWDRFGEELGYPKGKYPAAKDFSFSPSCEVTEDKAHYFFKLDLPGLTKDLVKIEIHDKELSISGERKEEKKEESKRSHLCETTYGSFLRSFTLPSNIDAEKVEAKFENGVLTVTVAKSEETRPRQVSIR